jgi:hypothetical protein
MEAKVKMILTILLMMLMMMSALVVAVDAMRVGLCRMHDCCDSVERHRFIFADAIT